MKFNRMLPTFGKREAESITRQEVLDWLDEQAEEHEWSDTTRNRYVAAFSLIYSVPARKDQEAYAQALGRITRRQEDNSRVRFLSQEEEAAISKELRERYPNYLNVFHSRSPHRSPHIGSSSGQGWGLQLADRMIKIHQTKIPANPRSVRTDDAHGCRRL